MGDTTVEFTVMCKRCNKHPVSYSGMMYEKMKDYGHSRPEYCDVCRAQLLLEKMTMGAAYFSVKTLPGTDMTVAIPGELGKVWHPKRPHTKSTKPKTFDPSMFGATPGKIVEIYEWLKDPRHQVVVVKGGTGSGKSTALPYWLIFPPEGVPSDFFTRDGQILITQPRILATTGISKYLGSLVGSSVGKGFDIGYRCSTDRNADRFNAAFMATDGTLINMIKKGELADLSVVMIDEAHERSLNIDIILHLMKEQLPLYPHLKLLIVSATINAESFLGYFGHDTATLVEFEPKSKHVYHEFYASENEKINYEDTHRLKKQLVGALVKKTVWLLEEQVEGRKEVGNVLAFLQGVKPIEEAVKEIRQAVAKSEKLKNRVEVLPLYSDLSEEESDYTIGLVYSPSMIRVVVCTNVAEASITVDGIVYVIESGVENQAQWEIKEGAKAIELRLISKANAKQRWGRAGRTRDGEVFCLYTKEQYEAMLDFPIPAIQRSSMEEIILKLKELGIDNYEENWIDAPIKEELDRSINSLKKSGAIDENDMLTEYGALLTQFQYPASLANLIIMADRFGCSVEVATLIPFIKNGGHRQFFVRDTNWDEPTKQRVEAVQNVLWQGCKDDVEFFFRMHEFWMQPPNLPDASSEDKKDLASKRTAWAKAFYVNFDVFDEDIEPERENVLRLLSGRRKDRNNRDIQLKLIERTRLVLAYCLPFGVVQEAYVFDPRLGVIPGESASCVLSLTDEKIKRIETLKNEKASVLKIAQELTVWEEAAEPADEVTKRVFKAPELPKLDTEVFANFEAKYKVGDELIAEVTGYTEHAGDFRVSLAVKETETGYKSWLTPSDLNFTQSSAVIKQIPMGTKLRVVVKEIIQDKCFARLYCLPLLEAELEKTYDQQKKIDGQIVTKAKIIDVRTDNRLVFVAEMSRPEEGFLLVIHAKEKSLAKEIKDYHVGEEYWVSFRPEPVFEFGANLPAVSENLKKVLGSSACPLKWAEGKLYFKGKMPFAEFQKLLMLDTDIEFKKALDYLYLSSNMNWASKVADAGWLEKVKAKYRLGNVYEVTVLTILRVGVLVSLDDQSGFIRTSESDGLKSGQKYKAKLLGFNEERQQLNFSLATPENSPLKRFKVGQEAEGVVESLQNYGAFVGLGMGFSGLIHISKMGRWVKHPSEILKVGDKVKVLVLDMKDEGGKLKISLSLVKVL